MFGFGPSEKSLAEQVAELERPLPPSSDPGPGPASKGAFGSGFTPSPVRTDSFATQPAELVSEAIEFYKEIQPIVSVKVQEMLDDPDGIFAVELANVAQFAKTIGPKCALLGDCMARVLRAEVVAKQQLEDLENAVKVQEAIVRRELKFGQGIDGRPPVRAPLVKATVADIDGEILLDIRVANSRLALSEFRQNNWAALVDLKARLHYALRALERMCNVIPGLQGVSRDLLRGEAL